jgi:hypothetical protein
MPINLRATNVTATSASIVWSASRDNVGVAGYDVYRDAHLVATVRRTSFADTGLIPSTTHWYQVVAFDSSNNTSHVSAALQVTLPAAIVPTTEPTIDTTTPTQVPTPSPTVDPTVPPTSDTPTTPPSYAVVSVSLTATVTGAQPNCLASIDATVTADGPLQTQLDYTIGSTSGSVPLTFTVDALTQTFQLPDTGDGTVDGAASATADGVTGLATWTACS